MRVALISLVERCVDAPADCRGALPLCASSIARLQLELALALGCQRILCLGNGPEEEALKIERAARMGGATVQMVTGAPQLIHAVRQDDELLVLAGGLFIDAADALALLGDAPCIATLPAETGIPLGFERIDADKAWAGALVMPGGLVRRLAELPDDVDPVACLLRIGLQARLAQRALPLELVSERRWALASTRGEVAALESAWLGRRLPRASLSSPASWIARALLDRYGSALLADRRGVPGVMAVAIVSLLAAFAAAWFGRPVASFVLLAPSAIGFLLAAGLAMLRTPKQAKQGGDTLQTGRLGAVLVDVGMVAAAASAIEGVWYQRLFPPAVMIALIWSEAMDGDGVCRNLLSDRVLMALALAVAAAFSFAEPAVMAWAVALLALRLTTGARDGG